MRTSWLVAKYTSDLRRREQRNVGVIAFRGGEVASRFMSATTTGDTITIDGRSARHWAHSLPNYRAWVDYWVRFTQSGLSDEALAKLLRRRSDSNYYLELGGGVLFGEDDAPAIAVEKLYSQLVERQSVQQGPEPIRHDARNVEALSVELFRTLDVWDRVEEDTLLVVDGQRAHFDYRFDNSVPNFMNRVELGRRVRDWKFVEAAAWSFEKARSEFRSANTIALVVVKEQTAESAAQQEMLRQIASVIDVADTNAASLQLRQLFHLPG